MKFEEVYAGTRARLLSRAEATEMPGTSERDHYEADGAEGHCDYRVGWVWARRAPVDGVTQVLELIDTHHWDFTAKHIREKLVAKHNVERS